MNEIEKLYKNAGIENELQDFRCHRNWGICENEHKCKICKHFELIYSVPFTAEKQLELIKWLLYHKSIDYLKMSYTSEEGGILDISIKCMSGYTYENDNDDDFNIALASLINELWQDLTEKEKQQIKEILE